MVWIRVLSCPFFVIGSTRTLARRRSPHQISILNPPRCLITAAGVNSINFSFHRHPLLLPFPPTYVMQGPQSRLQWWTPQPYLPSFTLVLTRAGYPQRLPAYRASHCRRFHPYPRFTALRDREDPLMMTIDHRYNDVHSNSVSSLPSVEEENPAIASLQEAMDDFTDQVGGHRGRVRRLSTLVIDLALHVTHKLQGLRISKRVQPVETAVDEMDNHPDS